jgi:hypothetical protein
MPASLYHIICEQGATLVRVVVYKDSAGTPVNLTGYSARMKVRTSRSADGVYLALATSGQGITVDSVGEIEITVPAVTTARIPSGRYYYDLEVVSSTGVVNRVVEGDFTVTGEVTR